MTEEMSPPAVVVSLSLGNSACENSEIANRMEIELRNRETETASLLSDPGVMLDDNSRSSWGAGYDCASADKNELASSMLGESKTKHDMSGRREITENGALVHDVQESEEDEILSVAEDPSSLELLPIDSTSDLSVPLDTTSDASLPIAVELEGSENGQIFAKVIGVEERSIKRRLSEDILKEAAKPTEECSGGPTIKASIVAVKLSSEKDSSKGGVKSVFELDCLPLWGSVSICGNRPEMEDAVMAAPHFMKIPIKMFIGDHSIDGISQKLSHLTSHFLGFTTVMVDLSQFYFLSGTKFTTAVLEHILEYAYKHNNKTDWIYTAHCPCRFVANYCRDRVHLVLVEELKNVKDALANGCTRDTRQVQWENVFTSCFLKVDDEVGGKVSRVVPGGGNTHVSSCTSEPVAPETVGSTAVVAVVSSSHIIVANCGDSRAVLYRGKEAIALSVDHKPNREDEYARIEASGGKVIQWNGHRVFGVLAMSRAIGDRYLKPWIIPEPEVMFVPRAREDECLVLASDGLWDIMTNEEVCEVARKRILLWHKKNATNPLADRGQGVDLAAQAAADYLSNLALQKGSKDNISIIVVDLKAQRKFKVKS
ncbi:UNVERIFIED_CONTAM: protein phosphatase 2C 16 [Sesamum latifolium]|uniref:Protein phosphatase 2C 16 n=1 Tax=Sesamum latifolium TaxID=2727402 RepID=A0AAW2UCS9_9LAMI